MHFDSEVHSPISIHQWGFQPKKSTTAALLNVYSDWSAALDKGKEVCAIFLEYAVPVWNPYLIKDVQKLESIQRFALKVCLKS